MRHSYPECGLVIAMVIPSQARVKDVLELALQILMVVGFSQYIGGAWEVLKTVGENTSEEVHLLVKLPVISLQACKFTKNELLHTNF